jgi:phospholipase/carboxylesterase
MLLLHGHLGNENVMWIFARKLPKDIIMLAPRAPQQLGPDQYSWHAITPRWPDLRTTYADLTAELLGRVDQWVSENGLDVQHYDVMGFSQGAVMAYALSFLHPEKINKVAALAGFIPHSWQKDLAEVSLADRSYFVSNGTEDDVIPIDQARQSLDWLKEKGAQVTYCEGHTGHKLSASCFGGLGEYFHSPSTD